MTHQYHYAGQSATLRHTKKNTVVNFDKYHSENKKLLWRYNCPLSADDNNNYSKLQ